MQRLTAVASALIFAAGLSALAEEADTPVAVGARLSQDANGAELSFDLSRPVDPRVYALSFARSHRHRSAGGQFSDRSFARARRRPETPRRSSKAFRFGLLAPHESRIVIDLGRSACPARVESKPIVNGAPGLPAEDRAQAVRRGRILSAGSPARQLDGCVRRFSRLLRDRSIVLDPGHGGSDGGARGVGGALEKTLVLAFCDELKRQLEVDQAVHGRDDARERPICRPRRSREHRPPSKRFLVRLDSRRHPQRSVGRQRDDRLYRRRSRVRCRGGSDRRARKRRRPGSGKRDASRSKTLESRTFCSI